MVDFGVRQRDDELFAAPPREHVTLAQRLADHRGEISEQHVAGIVPVRVVVRLEVVQVDQRDDRFSVRQRLKRLIPPAAVQQAREGVG